MTQNLSQRLISHNTGRVKSTKPFKPFYVIYKESLDNSQDARLREKYLKTSAGRKFINKFAGSPPD